MVTKTIIITMILNFIIAVSFFLAGMYLILKNDSKTGKETNEYRDAFKKMEVVSVDDTFQSMKQIVSDIDIKYGKVVHTETKMEDIVAIFPFGDYQDMIAIGGQPSMMKYPEIISDENSDKEGLNKLAVIACLTENGIGIMQPLILSGKRFLPIIDKFVPYPIEMIRNGIENGTFSNPNNASNQ